MLCVTFCVISFLIAIRSEGIVWFGVAGGISIMVIASFKELIGIERDKIARQKRGK